jgi:hypothetical protein
MPRYAQIEAEFFCDPDFKFSPPMLKVKVRYFYLFYAVTSKNLIGLYRTDEDVDRVSMGYSKQDFTNCKTILIERNKLLWEDGWIWIVGKAKKVEGEKQLTSAYKILREVSDGLGLKQKFLEKYRYPIDRVSMGDTPLALPIPIPIPKKEKIKDGEEKNSPSLSPFQQKEKISQLVAGITKSIPSKSSRYKSEEDKIIEPLWNLYKQYFPNCKKCNWGVMVKIIRGEDYPFTPENKIREAIEGTHQDNLYKKLDDPWARFLDRIRKPATYKP